MKKIDISTPKYPNTFTLVDDDDFEFLNQWKWRAIKGGRGDQLYVCRQKRHGKMREYFQMHRVIMAVDKKRVIDHINHDTLDNRKCNLRKCTQSENLMNQRKTYYHREIKKGYSKYKGVYRRPNGKWLVTIKGNGVVHQLGCFSGEKAAAKEYDKLAKLLHGEFACLNFPEN